jgi:hypothetical protein
MKRPRRPRQSFERLFALKPTAKQRIHTLLRRDPSISSRQLANAVGCTTAYARIWRRNFFAPTYEPEEPDSASERDTTNLLQRTGAARAANSVDTVQEKA